MNGSGVEMLGIVNFSVHMTGWVMTAESVKIWVPRRPMTGMSYPDMPDNIVGGSLPVGEKPIDGIVRECEKICLEPNYTRANIKPYGTNFFQLSLTDSQLPACRHQVQYLYEMGFDKTSSRGSATAKLTSCIWRLLTKSGRL